MVQYCSAFNCRRDTTPGLKLKFHRFPKDESVREKWLNAVKRKGFEPSKSSVICQKHFRDEDYFINPYGNKVLSKEAVPSIFDFFDDIAPKTRNVLVRKALDNTVSLTTSQTNEKAAGTKIDPHIPRKLPEINISKNDSVAEEIQQQKHIQEAVFELIPTEIISISELSSVPQVKPDKIELKLKKVLLQDGLLEAPIQKLK